MPKTTPFRIVHLSDLHLTVNDKHFRSEPKLFGKLCGMNAAFRKIVQSSPLQKANLILVTGDITDRGEIESWEVFWRALADAGLSDRVLVVPGNHDICCMGGTFPRKGGAERYVAKAVAGLKLGGQPTKFPWVKMPAPGIAVFGLSSNNLCNVTALTNAMGHIGYYQLESLANKLHMHRDVPVKIVLLHHSPNIPGELTAIRREQRPINPLERVSHEIPQNQRRALRLLCVTHRVRLVLHGHLHMSEDRKVNSIRMVGACASTEPRNGQYHFVSFAVPGDGGRVRSTLCSVKA